MSFCMSACLDVYIRTGLTDVALVCLSVCLSVCLCVCVCVSVGWLVSLV
jgi:uncharacterized membrane protein